MNTSPKLYNHDEIKISIDPGFSLVLPELPKDAYKGLEKDCRKKGILQPLVCWNQQGLDGSYPLIDGHNRHSIAIRHGLPFKVLLLPFKSYEDVLKWIVDHQENQRNPGELAMSEARFQMNELLKMKKGGDRKSEEFKSKVQAEPLKNTGETTRQFVARVNGVSESTVGRDIQVGQSRQLIKEYNPEFHEKIVNEEVTKTDVVREGERIREEVLGEEPKPKKSKAEKPEPGKSAEFYAENWVDEPEEKKPGVWEWKPPKQKPAKKKKKGDAPMNLREAVEAGEWIQDVVKRHFGKEHKATMFECVPNVSPERMGEKIKGKHKIDYLFPVKPSTKIRDVVHVGVQVVEKKNQLGGLEIYTKHYSQYTSLYYVAMTKDMAESIEKNDLWFAGLLVFDGENITVDHHSTHSPPLDSYQNQVNNELLIYYLKQKYYADDV